MNIRKLAVRAIGAAAIATATLGLAAPASAAPVVPGPASVPAAQLHLLPNGPLMPTLGQDNFCNGIVDTHIKTDPTRPGIAFVGFSSQGMHGVGPGWEANPVCRVKADVMWDAAWALGALGGMATGQFRQVDLQFGPTPSDITWVEAPTGPGAHVLGLSATYLSITGQLQPQFAYPVYTGIQVP